ncbi:unnamed protein product [Clonostachys byssicola]|uniref:hydroxyacylglutathione hydrolase n=1 Tax=Clonostachys byssicola TaxID=160290 RepID=A0A9N9YBM0_9HYPO|nr:unnamed protein product [Clonostachys byssicola]
MVKYILTPWRDREELLLVRHQFYAASPSWLGEHSRMWHQDATKHGGLSEGDEEGKDDLGNPEAGEQERRRRRRMAGVERLRRNQRLQLHQAVARVSMWMQRGNCPHMVESTALLTAAVLSDEELMVNTKATGVDNVTASSAYAVRAAYSAAFSRFVTGLLDGHQDKQRKQSMYSLARTIGLPATFVELRHQSTHEQLPSLAKLRSAAKKALRWIWGYYWRHLAGDDLLSETCEDALLRYLREGDHDPDADRRSRLALERRWDVGTLLSCLSRLQDTLPGNQAYVKCMRLSRELVEAEEEEDQEPPQPFPPAAGPASDPQDGAAATGWAHIRTMHIEAIPLYDKSKDAVIIDPANPPEVVPVLKEAISSGRINLTAIVNTHHHWDHAGGNKKLLTELGTPNLTIIGGKDCEGVTQTPKHNEVTKLGDIKVTNIYTPCHTQDSICYFLEDSTGKAVFTGDTLFISGCGKFFEGTADQMHEALNKRLGALPDETVVYPGHEYTKSNVKFTVSVSQTDAIKKLQAFADDNQVTTGKFTIGDEKKHNVFMRVEDPEIQKATGETDPVSVMGKLREMKNNFNTNNTNQTTGGKDMTDEITENKGKHVQKADVRRHAYTHIESQGVSQNKMPPKRKTGAAASAPKAPPRSKLAKEHNISAQEEGEIKEAFSLFAEPMDGEKNGVIPIDDVKSALIALGIPASSPAELREFISILDPESDGFATYEPFLAICALKFHSREDDTDEAHRHELEEAFRLFTNGQGGTITLAHLRRVAAVLKEDVDEEVLKDMILEANGGAGVARGVELAEFDGVMKNAGVWR